MILVPLLGQTTKPIHPKRVPMVVDERPVTEREARAVFSKVCQLFLQVNGRPLSAPSIPNDDRLVSRDEIVAEMFRLYRSAEPTIRFVPASVPHDSKRFRIAPTSVDALETLVTRGFVARLGPLAVGPQLGVSPRQLGDAVGFFMDRLAQVTHMPSPKWTPDLRGE